MAETRSVPNPGRIIHVTATAFATCDPEVCRPAMVTGIEHSTETIYLTALTPEGDFRYEEKYTSGNWHWPAKGLETLVAMDR